MVSPAVQEPTPTTTPSGLPDAGGQPTDGRSAALTWLAIIAGSGILIGGAGFYLALQRRRIR